MTYVAILLFLLTLVFVIWQPRGLSIGWSATGGAALALLFHVVTWQDVWSVTKIVWDATLAFVAIIIISTVLDQIGFFEWAALKMAKAARGDGKKVFFYVILLGALVAAVFANDGAALILTPIVLEKMKLLQLDARRMFPFVIASGFIADTTSLPFVVSNLVNIVSADYFHIGFLTYLAHMLVPDVVSLGASAGLLYLFFRKDIPERYDPEFLPHPSRAIAHQRLFRMSWILLMVLMAGYMVTEIFHIPVSFIAGIVAIALLVYGGKVKVIRPWSVIRGAPWAIVFFSIGMYVVVYGLRNVGLTHLLGNLIELAVDHGLFAGTLVMGFLAAILSSVMNNMPTVMIDALAIHVTHTTDTVRSALAYANVIGCDLGPKLTPIGSLATLLWLHVLRQKGVTVTWVEYIRTGVILTMPTLLLTLMGLYGWLAIVK
ncbi:arsenic transporter [Alicyclobacillus acidocaldarius]|uniref:Arsenical pump membrane protein n=1 Tax=Alicyclobacillus acidocaldarius subsp. acidocaldarius (strain ATCC 27009 / DSM 446 / BCRC 14685 / JCM 5260 / KCTC 1825 / NBRC 15652 / NCIMB 11725 / NRRL B-14509 / 104-IA) TaxID=521098 RepID=C8WST1_ALIAD|nr:arsenic transporter [Alicyclobacillus acidocaldarius]ACV57587.1 Arsenical pump membrane protein [Alicyclobacillus acidocaldarius subsp. acidocaldarius DSM 446]